MNPITVLPPSKHRLNTITRGPTPVSRLDCNPALKAADTSYQVGIFKLSTAYTILKRLQEDYFLASEDYGPMATGFGIPRTVPFVSNGVHEQNYATGSPLKGQGSPFYEVCSTRLPYHSV